MVLIQCSKYFVSLLLFEAPKVSLTLLFFCFFNVSLYQTMSVLCLWPFKMCSSHIFFILSPSPRLSFFFFVFLGWGGGVRRICQLIWDTRGANLKKFLMNREVIIYNRSYTSNSTIPWRKNECSLTKNSC